jgi:hypothetical protein
MPRYLTVYCLIIAACFALPAWADVTYENVQDGDDEIRVARMTVSPAAEPVPALRHRLVARDIDLQAGNAAPYYYRALLDSTRTMDRVRKEFGDEFDTWYFGGGDVIPIGNLPLDKVRKAVEMSNSPIRDYLRDAMLHRDCDWALDIESLRGPNVIAVLLPEFQESRELGRILSLQSRLATAEQRYEDAIEAIRMNYRLGRDVATGPLLVCGLIGIAIDGIANLTATELIAAPDSPNMYWALTELPQPAIDLRPATRFEMDFGPRMFPFIHHAETTDRSPQEWNRLYAHAFRDLAKVGEGGISWRNDTAVAIGAIGTAIVGYSHAKAQLIAQGMDSGRVEKMAVGQVMAIYTERMCQQFADDFQKLWYVPFSDMRKYDDELGARLRDAGPFGGGQHREVLPIAAQLLPAMQWARTAQVRLEREVAALRIIEALRMYAAEHGGGLPKTLDEITAVPVPPNPATGKPFAYRLDGQTAVLELPNSDGLHSGNRRYEIQIAAKDK